MRIVKTEKIYQEVKRILCEIAFAYPSDVQNALAYAKSIETEERASAILTMLEENAQIAQEENIPICQDTGMVVVYSKIGQEVYLEGEYIECCIQRAVREAYQESYLRKSIVSDPLFERINTNDNTPAIVYYQIVEGDQIEIEVVAKGFGSENMSALKMCKPADGLDGVKEFVIETIKKAGPNACPPMVVGIGVGGSFDYATFLAKKALFRSFDSSNEKKEYADLEKELLKEINELNIGPMGLKGKTTALKVNIEWFPTHIAALPVAVNINCHVHRHQKVLL